MCPVPVGTSLAHVDQLSQYWEMKPQPWGPSVTGVIAEGPPGQAGSHRSLTHWSRDG